MMTKIKLFLQFLYKFILNRFKGTKIQASKETQTERLATCTGCPYRAENTCMACGCFINVKVKLQDSECPHKYWLN